MPDVVLVVTFKSKFQPYQWDAAFESAVWQRLGAAFQSWVTTTGIQVSWRPRYRSVKEDRIDQLVAAAAPNGFVDPGFLSRVEGRVTAGIGARRLYNRLQTHAKVKTVAYPAVRTPLATLVSVYADAASSRLHYQGPSSIQMHLDDGSTGTFSWGVDVEYARLIEAGRGEGTCVVDVEKGWNLEHVDLSAHSITKLVPAGMYLLNGGPGDEDDPSVTSNCAHGTSVLGILAGKPSGAGVTGCAREAAAIGVAGVYVWSGSGIEPDADPHNALLRAIDFAEAKKPDGGAVILIEVAEDFRSYTGGSARQEVPLELRDEIHTLIKFATSLDQTVVEAAGNDTVDLDGLDYSLSTVFTPPWDVPPELPVDIHDPAVNDSGAVIVGSTAPPIYKSGTDWFYLTTEGGRHRRRANSTHGERVDCFAWGDYVWSCGEVDAYQQFSDTSAAAAIVAGVILVLQGLWARHAPAGSDPLTPGEVRDLLRDPTLGTPLYVKVTTLTGDMYDVAGYIPDLFKILTQSAKFQPLGLVPDVYARDHVGDTGAVHTGAVAVSPDIIIRQSPDPDPQGHWGEGSGNENDDALSETVRAGDDHTVYVRARNRGKAAARNLVAPVYWAEPSTLLTPGMWHPVSGDPAVFDELPADDTLWVSHPLDWPADPAMTGGHYCFITALSADGDPGPDLSTLSFPDFAAFKDWVRAENNVAWRNFTVLEAKSTLSGPVWFMMPGAFDATLEFTFEISLPPARSMDLVLVLPRAVYGGLPAPVPGAVSDDATETVSFQVADLEGAGRTRTLGPVALPRYDARSIGSAAPRRSGLVLMPSRRATSPVLDRDVDIAIVQRHEGDEVGRLVVRAKAGLRLGPA